MGKLTRGRRVVKFIERYCRVPEGTLVGKHVKLDEFQIKFILDVYDNPYITDTAILSMARKNAKTALIAFLVIVHLVGPEARLNSRIVSGALSRDQASEVYNYAAKCVQLSPDLSALIHCIPSTKKLIGLPMSTEYQALSADAKRSQGKSPVLAILDEVGQITGPRSDFVDAITTAQGAHENALTIYISTQAATDGDLLSILIDDAIDNKHEKTVCHLHAADEDCDILDEKQWAKANPALGKFRSYNDVKNLAEKADRMPSFENAFRNLILNQRISRNSPWLSKSVWESCEGPIEPLLPTDIIYAGLDLSSRRDLTALVILYQRAKIWQAKAYFWTPEEGLLERAKEAREPYDVWHKQGLIRVTPGNAIDLAFVARDIAEILGGFHVEAIGYDRWRIDVLKKEFERQGIDLPLVEFGQGFKDATVGIEAAEVEILNGNFRHGKNPVLTMCVRNVIISQDEAGNRKFNKIKATGRIDGAVALAMGFGIMPKDITKGLPPPKFQMMIL